VAKDLRYWDSCTFSGFLNEEPDKVADCQSVLKAAQNGHILIVTSALTLAEVLFIKGGTKLPAEKRQTVEQFFKADYISVRNVTRHVGELARDVFWDHGVNPKDAVHVATAAMFKVPQLNTFDDGLLKKNGIVVSGHTLNIMKPHHEEQLDLPVGKPTEPEGGG
jgi:predicted nucleic acid-binding protein